MRTLLPLPLLLVACGGGDDLWWLTADNEAAEVGSGCIGHPLHETYALGQMWAADERVLDLGGRTYTGPVDGYDLATVEHYASGRAVEADFDLDLEGGVLRGEWRYDETSTSDVTCARAIPVTLHPIARELGTWEISGTFANSSVTPEGCRGDLGDDAYAVLLTAWETSDGAVGAQLSSDPVQGQARSFGGTRNGQVLDLQWGGLFDSSPTPNTWTLSVDGRAGTASLEWTATECTLTLDMTAEAR